MTAYWARRLRRHALLALASGLMVAIVYAGVPAFPLRRWNLATAYASLALLALALLIGPWNVVMGRPNPVSQDLRRDLGIWAAILALAHTVFGLQVHMRGQWWLYFIWPADQPHRLPIRTDGFGFANYTGLASTLILILLLTLSNDVALRRLGTKRWKALQRWNYAGALLMAAHAVAFQVMEKRALYVVGVFALTSLGVLAGQVTGFLRTRRAA